MPTIDNDIITIVSGLPRSGTSLMMALLNAAELSILSDKHRPADNDNPLGYFEYEPVKNSRESIEWVIDARGKAVKVISPLLKHMPKDEKYKVILMRRSIEEVYASQQVMLINRGKPTCNDSTVMNSALINHQHDIENWLTEQAHMHTLIVDFRQLIFNANIECKELCTFLGISKDNLKAMIEIVNPEYYRQRSKNT